MTTFGPKIDALLAKRKIHPRRFKVYLVGIPSVLFLLLLLVLYIILSNKSNPQSPATNPEWCACGVNYVKCKASKDVCEEKAKICLINCPYAPTTPEDFFDIFNPGHPTKRGLEVNECDSEGGLEHCLGVDKGSVDTDCIASAHSRRVSFMPNTNYSKGHHEHETDGLKLRDIEKKGVEVSDSVLTLIEGELHSNED